jgi:hypothetical protein
MMFSFQWNGAMREIMGAAKRMVKCHGEADAEDANGAGVNCDGIENALQRAALQCAGGMCLERRCRWCLENKSEGDRSSSRVVYKRMSAHLRITKSRVAPRAMSHHQRAAFRCCILKIDRFYSTFN